MLLSFSNISLHQLYFTNSSIDNYLLVPWYRTFFFFDLLGRVPCTLVFISDPVADTRPGQGKKPFLYCFGSGCFGNVVVSDFHCTSALYGVRAVYFGI